LSEWPLLNVTPHIFDTISTPAAAASQASSSATSNPLAMAADDLGVGGNMWGDDLQIEADIGAGGLDVGIGQDSSNIGAEEGAWGDDLEITLPEVTTSKGSSGAAANVFVAPRALPSREDRFVHVSVSDQLFSFILIYLSLESFLP
jgi:hypothetical protein